MTFDIYVPQEYPAVPPKVQYLTTGGGRVRVNPNLYTEGKVCLSLLGTWQGPGWDPSVSSLSQVLLSIQSYVLNSLPIQQEPGHESNTTSDFGRLKCARHNADVRLAVLRHGILEPLTTPPLGFEELAETHFRLKAFELEAQVIRWAEEAVLMARLEIEVERWSNPAYIKVLTDSLPKSSGVFSEVHARAAAMKSTGEWTVGRIEQQVHTHPLKGPTKNNPLSVADLCTMLSALRPMGGAARMTIRRERPFSDVPPGLPAVFVMPSLTRANSLGGEIDSSGGADSQQQASLAHRLSRLSESLRALLLSGTGDVSTLAAAVDASMNVERVVSALRANGSAATSASAAQSAAMDEFGAFTDEKIVESIDGSRYSSVFWTAHATIIAADDIIRILEAKRWLGDDRAPPLEFAALSLTSAGASSLASSARARRSGFALSMKAQALRKAANDASTLLAARFSSSGSGFAVVGSLATGAATLSSDVDIVVFPSAAHTEAAKTRKMSAIVCGILGEADQAPLPPVDSASTTPTCASAAKEDEDNKALTRLVSTAVAPHFSCEFIFNHKKSGKQHIQLTHVETGVHVDLVSTDKDEAAVAQRTTAVKLFIESEPLLADLHSLLNDALGLAPVSPAAPPLCQKHGDCSTCPPYPFHGCPYRDSSLQKLTGHAVLLLSRMALRTPDGGRTASGGGAELAVETLGAIKDNGYALFKALCELADENAFLARLKSGQEEFELDELPSLGGTIHVSSARVKELCGVASWLRDSLASGKALEFCLAQGPPPAPPALKATPIASTPENFSAPVHQYPANTPSLFGFAPGTPPMAAGFSPGTPPIAAVQVGGFGVPAAGSYGPTPAPTQFPNAAFSFGAAPVPASVGLFGATAPTPPTFGFGAAPSAAPSCFGVPVTASTPGAANCFGAALGAPVAPPAPAWGASSPSSASFSIGAVASTTPPTFGFGAAPAGAPSAAPNTPPFTFG